MSEIDGGQDEIIESESELDKNDHNENLNFIETKKYEILRQEFEETSEILNEFQSKIEQYNYEKLEKLEWENYVRCNKLPNVYDKNDIYKYINMLESSYNNEKITTLNWLLDTDERTILTQDKYQQNRTAKYLSKKQISLGDKYVAKMKEILTILAEINDYIEIFSISKISNDMKNLKNHLRELIRIFSDDLTYSVLSHIDRDMECIRYGWSLFSYKSSILIAQIWAIRQEEKLKSIGKENNNRLEIKFPLLNFEIIFPSSIKGLNTAFRVLWLSYDHFSDQTLSYNKIIKSTLKLVSFNENVLNFSYLDEYEINLRSHRILNGVYYVDFLEIPQQDLRLNLTSFIQTIIYPNEIQIKSYYEEYKPPPAVPPGARRLPEEIEAEMKIIEKNLEKLILITLELPDSVLWLEPPIVCLWENNQIENNNSIDNELLDDQTNEYIKNSKTIIDDFNLCDIPKNIDIKYLIKKYIIPILPQQYSIRLENSSEKLSKKFLYLSRYNNEISIQKCHNISIKDYFCQNNLPNRLYTNEIIKLPKIIENQHIEHKCYTFLQLIKDLENIQESSYDIEINEINKQILHRKNSEEINNLSINSTEIDETDSNENTKISLPVGKWSTKDIHDLKFNEDKLSIQFRTGRLGYFGLAINYYINMPYQTWELKPDPNCPDTIIFNLTAAIISLELIITYQGFSIKSLQGGHIDSISNIFNKILTLNDLKKFLINAGINIFPEHDAFNYIKGPYEKNLITEMHIYDCISLLSLTHNFSWSRWNLLSGQNTIIILMREKINGNKALNYSTILVTENYTTIVDCTEISTAFSSDSIEGHTKHGDILHLALASSNNIQINKIKTINPILKDNIKQILSSTRILSLS